MKKLKEKKVIKKQTNVKNEFFEEIKEKPKTFITGFMNFLNQYSVVGLAIGLVIGNSSQNIVKSLVDGIITPSLSLILKIFFPTLTSLSSYTLVFEGVEFKIGALVQVSIEFLILLFIIYLVIAAILKREDLLPQKKEKK
jgi:large conductance mechanosensitive channel